MPEKFEQEVIIRWDKGDDGVADICAAIPAIWRALEKGGWIAARVDCDSSSGAVRCKIFEIPRGQISISIAHPKRPRKSAWPGFRVRAAKKSKFRRGK